MVVDVLEDDDGQGGHCTCLVEMQHQVLARDVESLSTTVFTFGSISLANRNLKLPLVLFRLNICCS